MDNQLENKISMYIKTETMLTNRAAEMVSIPLIAAEKINFSAKLATLLTKTGIANLDITGNTVDKQDKRTALTKTAITICRAMVIHANITNNKLLLEKFDVSLSTVNQMRDSEFYVFCQVVKDNATPLSALLSAYGIVATTFTQLNTELTAFYNVIQKPKDQISEQSIVREEIDVLVTDIDKILYTKLDVAVSIFQFSNPSLYSAYQNARSIDDTSATTTPDYEGDITPSTILALANIPYLGSRTFRLKNTGTVPLVLSLSNNSSIIQGAFVTIAPGVESINYTSLMLNADVTANNILLQNNDIANSGNYKLYIYIPIKINDILKKMVCLWQTIFFFDSHVECSFALKGTYRDIGKAQATSRYENFKANFLLEVTATI